MRAVSGCHCVCVDCTERSAAEPPNLIIVASALHAPRSSEYSIEFQPHWKNKSFYRLIKGSPHKVPIIKPVINNYPVNVCLGVCVCANVCVRVPKISPLSLLLRRASAVVVFVVVVIIIFVSSVESLE